MRRTKAALALVASMCVAFSSRFVFAQEDRTAAGAEPLAILVRGTEPVKGIPGFADNAFAAIYGEYFLKEKDAKVRVWATREALYFDPRAWVRYDIEGKGVWLAEDRRRILAAELVAPWTAIAVFPSETLSRTESDRFFRLFLERFNHFLVGAKLPTDASFPASF